MGFIDCCSNILTKLPGPSLPFLPAFFLGTIFASLILLYLYKKETNLPLNDILLHAFRSLFLHLPSNGCSASDSETDKCNNVQCVRCQRYGELQHQIIQRWRRLKGREIMVSVDRVEQAVRRLQTQGKLEKSEKITDVTRNEREEERKIATEEETGGKLKYRGKQKRHEGKASSPDQNNGEMKDWNKEIHEEKKAQKDGGCSEDEKEKTMQDKVEKEMKKGKLKTQMTYQKPTLFHVMGLPANPNWTEYDVLTNEQKLLKLNFELITQEFEKVFSRLQSGDTTGWKNNSILEGHWCIFPFVDQGKINTSNCHSCPRVAEIILGCLPAMMNDCVFGNAAFSILYPDSHITPHQGPTNLRLRCHLGIKVPNGCWLEVAGQQYKWVVGETLLFDDSFTHSAHFTNQPNNMHSQPRAILLLDFWHPNVTIQEKECLLELLTPLGV
ncbi:Aspartate beta-hydroxylase domain-containing protein 2 [Portunus trituberculatus]|uniref:Aspartate beta-hydroxylase domain-containing protein 2 n=1 Tax=Portunus trituberculatus TaxID=210409 RepID=A0A5B7ET59_PORTR|nr:Aspartate beta-hydroxylase domain-containing protein 2 [Portunus trituberculatus]